MATKKKRKKVVLVEFCWRVSTIKRLAAAKGISFYALILFAFGMVAKVTFKYGLEIMLLILLPLIALFLYPSKITISKEGIKLGLLNKSWKEIKYYSYANKSVWFFDRDKKIIAWQPLVGVMGVYIIDVLGLITAINSLVPKSVKYARLTDFTSFGTKAEFKILKKPPSPLTEIERVV